MRTAIEGTTLCRVGETLCRGLPIRGREPGVPPLRIGSGRPMRGSTGRHRDGASNGTPQALDVAIREPYLAPKHPVHEGNSGAQRRDV